MDWRNAKVEGDTITIKKKDLEEMRDNYRKTSDRYDVENVLCFYYDGKVDVMTDLLNQFETLEG